MSLKFICDLFSLEEANVVVFGVPIGKDSKKVLDSLRKTSDFVESFDLDKKRNLLDNVRVADVSNLKLKNLDEITKKTREILDMGKIPLIIGGNHLLTLFTLKAFKDVKLIVFDAHSDLKDVYDYKIFREMDFVKGIKFNPRVNDATWLRRACEFLDPKNILLIGIRSSDEFDLDFIEKNGISYFTPNQIRDNISKIKEKLRRFIKNSRVYISLDMDVFDPSIAPAVHHPEPNGLFLHQFMDLIDAFKGKLVGLDLCCVKHSKDNRTEFLATRTVFEILSLIGKN